MKFTGLMLLWIAVLPGDSSQDFHLDFRRTQNNPLGLERFSRQTARWIHSEPGGLRIRVPAKRPFLEPVGLDTRFGIRGDFEITAGFQVLSADEPKSGFGVGVALRIEKANPSPETATVARVVRRGGRQVALWDHRFVAAPNTRVKYELGEAGPAGRSGRLRLQRTGKILSYQWAEGANGNNFREIHQCKFGDEDLERVLLQVATSREPRAIEARWLDFHIRGEILPRSAQSPPPGHKPRWLAFAITGVVLLAAITGWWYWRRRRLVPAKKGALRG